MSLQHGPRHVNDTACTPTLAQHKQSTRWLIRCSEGLGATAQSLVNVACRRWAPQRLRHQRFHQPATACMALDCCAAVAPMAVHTTATAHALHAIAVQLSTPEPHTAATLQHTAAATSAWHRGAGLSGVAPSAAAGRRWLNRWQPQVLHRSRSRSHGNDSLDTYPDTPPLLLQTDASPPGRYIRGRSGSTGQRSRAGGTLRSCRC